MQNYSIGTATLDEMRLMVDWGAEEGWNPGLHDAECYRKADPEGFLMGFLDGEPISSVSAVRYGDFGFIGYFLVRPSMRGKGYGRAIWLAAMERLQGCVMGLDGVLEQQDNYRRDGFVLAFRNIRYEVSGAGEVAAGVTGVAAAAGAIIDINTQLPAVEDALMAYTEPFFPASRRDFLGAWLRQRDGRALAIRGNLKPDAIAGYGVMRRCRTGYRLGPLFADSPELAETLFSAFRGCVGTGESLTLDVPECHSEAVRLAERHGMQPAFETARMYLGPAPDIGVERTYSVTSFEIG